MFGKYKLTLGRIRDAVEIDEGGESIVLHVNADPQRMVAGLSLVQGKLKTITEETSAEDIHTVAMMFAEVIFGKEQAQTLSEFYHGDSGCMISVCSKYFGDRLRKLIKKAQKRRRP